MPLPHPNSVNYLSLNGCFTCRTVNKTPFDSDINASLLVSSFWSQKIKLESNGCQRLCEQVHRYGELKLKKMNPIWFLNEFSTKSFQCLIFSLALIYSKLIGNRLHFQTVLPNCEFDFPGMTSRVNSNHSPSFRSHRTQISTFRGT